MAAGKGVGKSISSAKKAPVKVPYVSIDESIDIAMMAPNYYDSVVFTPTLFDLERHQRFIADACRSPASFVQGSKMVNLFYKPGRSSLHSRWESDVAGLKVAMEPRRY